jgi:hypothetical protein
MGGVRYIGVRAPSPRWHGVECLGMLDRIGFFPSRPTCRHEGKTAPMPRNLSRDRADADLLRRTAACLRDDPDGARRAGLTRTEDALALAALLDLLAVELPHVDAVMRLMIVESCGRLLN